MINPWKSKSKINPQSEQGHRRISTELLHALIKTDLNAAEFKIILVIIDMTWGYREKSASITLSQFVMATSLSRRTILYSVQSLRDKRIIQYQPSKTLYHGMPINEYMFNKHYDTWVVDNPVDKERCKELHWCKSMSLSGAKQRSLVVQRTAPLYRKNINNINSVSKLTSNKNINNIKTILEGLRRHAPKHSIITALKTVDRSQWYSIRSILMHTYKSDGERAYNNAVTQLKKEEVKV